MDIVRRDRGVVIKETQKNLRKSYQGRVTVLQEVEKMFCFAKSVNYCARCLIAK